MVKRGHVDGARADRERVRARPVHQRRGAKHRQRRLAVDRPRRRGRAARVFLMRYTPGPVPSDLSPGARAWLAAELRRISDALRLPEGLELVDGVTAPATVEGRAQLYVDVVGGDLKVKFGDGT